MNGKRPALLVILFLQLFVLAACSSQQVTLTDPERDPWEAYNRKMPRVTTSSCPTPPSAGSEIFSRTWPFR
jgi:ABC-type transporter lipoprotein component MlaA